MSGRQLLVVQDGHQTPAWNMAVDEALLEAPGSWLRLYRWQPFAISLGYFQRIADFAAVAPELPRVRRPSGGGAILHADEITLALAVPADWLPATVAASYELVNAAVREAVSQLGRDLRTVIADSTAAPRAASWCFATPTRLDLAGTDGGKVFGSAQRRRGDRVLHHGSLVLHRHSLTSFTGALELDAASLAQPLVHEIARALDATPVAHPDFPAAVLERAAALTRERYANPAWTERR